MAIIKLFFCVFFFGLSALTASFDQIGSFDLAGGNMRVTNLTMMGFNLLGLFSLRGGLPNVRAFGWLAAWTLANTICIANAPQIFRTYAFLIWLLVDITFIYSCAVVFRGRDNILWMAQFNYWSYMVMTAFGLAQFVLFLGGVNILVQQIFAGSIPRINGLSYEPSYYATYLIVGWGMSFYLLLYPNRFLSRPILWLGFLAQTAALLLSTSRIGFLGMGLMLMAMLPRIARILLSSGVKGALVSLMIAVLAILAGAGALRSLKNIDLTIFLTGTGLGNTASHSADIRMNDFRRYRDLFLSNPFKGYSLGGTAGIIVGADKGKKVDYDAMRQAQGINVTMEIVLAAGILGAPFFFFYLYRLTLGILPQIFHGADPDLVVLTKANAWGLLLQFFLLQFNQNILRNYFWIQIAVVSCLATEIFRQRREFDALPEDVRQSY